MLLYQIEGRLQKAKVVKRPSATCKSPYVADVLIENQPYIAHTPSLGCCGLSEKDCVVYVNPIKNPKGICTHSIQLSQVTHKDGNLIVGIHTRLAEKLTESALQKNCITSLQNITDLKSQKKFLNSVFDFSGIMENGKRFVLEVKSVPLADYEDITKKERKTRDYSDRSFNSKVAYFPDGYRKKKGDVVSPRALKHINELKQLCLQGEVETFMCYVIQRDDACTFQTSVLDPTYREAVKQAADAGVHIITLQVKWNENGEAHFVTDNMIKNL